ncbi:MAG: HAMP domain-containing protein [Acidobacteria bacterium]|nr:HAMP domain-containing protein [Acidobacteriota bacterium]
MRLLTKIWLSTSLAITVLFVVTGWIVSQHLVNTTMKQLTAEVASSLRAYRSLWRARAQALETLSGHISRAPHVRAAFGTSDVATIRDTAGDLLRNLEREIGEGGLLVVADPRGRVITRLAVVGSTTVPDELHFVDQARARFPAQQSGFGLIQDRLYQFVVTPVYVQSGTGLALINVLVTGFEVSDAVAAQLKLSTGSDFAFYSGSRLFASTLERRASSLLSLMNHRPEGVPERLAAPDLNYIELSEPLLDLEGRKVGRLSVLRSLEAATAGYAALRRQIAAIWIVSLGLGFLITYVLARRIIRPIEALDHAAAEVAHENYASRVEPVSNDEIGRLARTFNNMCASIQDAREELIRNERLSTIGRLASSIVHDLRNPLAAIYGGSELLVHTELPVHQQKRLAGNIYKASRKMQDMLADLLNISRGKTTEEREERPLRDIVQAAVDPLRSVAETQRVELVVSVPDEVLVAADRGRLERAFSNLLVNALEEMPGGGHLTVDAHIDPGSVTVRVQDTGPGIRPEIREQLFQPFASAGKRNGMGLGLALARQTVRDHGGEMWVESEPGRGAAFFIRLPLAQPVAEPAADLQKQNVT